MANDYIDGFSKERQRAREEYEAITLSFTDSLRRNLAKKRSVRLEGLQKFAGLQEAAEAQGEEEAEQERGSTEEAVRELMRLISPAEDDGGSDEAA